MDVLKAEPDSDPDQNPAFSHIEAREDILVPITVLEVKDEVMVS